MQPSTRDRMVSAFMSIALTVACGCALILGLRVSATSITEKSLALFEVAPIPVPPEFVTPRPALSARPAGRAAPPNLHARPKEVVAPTPIVVPPVAPVVLAAPVAATGPAITSGATDSPGPGNGAGGDGDGRGAGGYGDGTGGGSVARRFRYLRGELRDDDLPDAMVEAGIRGLVVFDFTVGLDGRVTRCVVTESSGHSALDALTCRLFRERLRYRPSLDAEGRPVVDHGTGEQGWGVE